MARATGLTIVTKLLALCALIALTGILAAAVLVPYVGGIGLTARAGANKYLDARCGIVEQAPSQRSNVYASDGKTLIASFYSQNRQVVPLSKVSKYVVQALISTEDRRFYSHHGIDIRGLARAAVNNSNGGTNVQGASTVTEQYVKQVAYYNAISKNDMAAADAAINQNVNRKITDAKCAVEMEGKYKKNQILEKYLNIAFFGEQSYGIEVAAHTYFGVSAAQLTIPQAAMIVGLVKSPTSLDPFTNLAAARQRRDVVIDNMMQTGDITAAQAAAAKDTPLVTNKSNIPTQGCAFSKMDAAHGGIKNVGFFCDYVVAYLAKNKILTEAQLDTGGYKVVTTIDKGLQNQGQTAVWHTSDPSIQMDPKSDYLLAMPGVDPRSGKVLTMITTKHYGTGSGATVNPIFTSAFAGSGSTYKYFTTLAYLKSIADPTISLYATDPYTPTSCNSGPYRTINAGHYIPYLPLFKALPESSNTYFVAMEDQFFGCNLSPIVNTALSLGMNALEAPDYADNHGKNSIAHNTVAEHRPTFTLGQTPTSALELTSALGAVGNDGVFCPPTPLKSITDSAGKAVAYKKSACTRQFSSFVARTLVNIMVNDTRPGYGTASSYFANWYSQGYSPVAAKTGTDNASDPVTHLDNGLNSALWFVGITPHLVSAAAIENPKEPKKTIANVPGVSTFDNGSEHFGAYGAQYWLGAYQPWLLRQGPWTWDTPQSTPGVSTQLGMYTGMSVDAARAQLTALGFKPHVISSYSCGSRTAPAGSVAGWSPYVATPGSEVTVCLSGGLTLLKQPAPPKPPKTVKPTRPGARTTPTAGASAGTHRGGGH